MKPEPGALGSWVQDGRRVVARLREPDTIVWLEGPEAGGHDGHDVGGELQSVESFLRSGPPPWCRPDAAVLDRMRRRVRHRID